MSTTEAPYNFGGLEPALSNLEYSKVLIWPVPFEKTVSYGQGTHEGPSAIIDASRYLETYDEELGGEPALVGIHTLAPIEADRSSAEMMEDLYNGTHDLLKLNKFLCTLGGEHSISSPVVRAFAEKYPKLSVLQIDAHSDLRDSYEGSRFSHASAMRRIVEMCPAVQVGIRSISVEEVKALPHLPTRIFYAKDLGSGVEWVDAAVDATTEDVYLTVDVDGFDPSLVPFTGTPEPGGLNWYQVMTLIRTLAAKRRIVGMDVVELCRSAASTAPSVLAAKLIYKTIGYVFRDQIPPLS